MRGTAALVLWLSFAVAGALEAQSNPMTVTFGTSPTDTNVAPNNATTNAATPLLPVADAVTNAAPEESSPVVETPAQTSSTNEAALPPNHQTSPTLPNPEWRLFAALLTLASVVGFLLYQGGLTRAKNCGHTSTLLLVGVTFGLIGYWMGGFAVQTGGIGDAHAALMEPLAPAERSALDHELGGIFGGHHWGLMGSSGFFLATDPTVSDETALLFLCQAALLVLALAAALGAALERGRILPMAVGAFLIGAVIYPLLANWVWGGGWLAELGREFGLGHGLVDLAGAGVVHETAGTLALVIALVLGPRHGRFGHGKPSLTIPGHNVPFVVLGAVVLLISVMATNAMAYANPAGASSEPGESSAGLAAVNALLAAAGGLLISFIVAGWSRRRPEPAMLCRGLLGGVVAVSASSALIDPWAAFVIGIVAGLVVLGAKAFLERRRIDDPSGASAVHGACGAWGVVALGLFANGTAGAGINGVDSNVRGLFFGGAWHQLAAQAIGVATDFLVVLFLGFACFILIQKILGTRADLEDELEGLDWAQTGALGYQGDSPTEDS